MKNIVKLIALATIIIFSSCNKESVIENYLKVSGPIDINKTTSIRAYSSGAWFKAAQFTVGPENDFVDCSLELYSYLKIGATGNQYTTTDSVWVIIADFSKSTNGASITYIQQNLYNGLQKYNLNDAMPTTFSSPQYPSIMFSAKRSVPYASNIYNIIGNGTTYVQGNYFSNVSYWQTIVNFGDEFYLPFKVTSPAQKVYYGWVKVKVDRTSFTVVNFYYSQSPTLKMGATK